MDTAQYSVSTRHNLRRALTLLFCAWFACSTTYSNIALAQNTGSDFEAPIIEHEDVGNGLLGDIETFVASVVDNEAVENVSLFYRLKGDTKFTELPMSPLNASSYYYSAKIDTANLADEKTAIEYYIRAEDSAGNLVLKGFAFEPLVRTLLPAVPPGSSIDANVTQDSTPTVAPKSKINWVYVALGALVLGGIAAGASGGGSDDVAPAGDCSPNCLVTLTISPP